MQKITKNQLKEYSKLKQKKYRLELGKVIVEGSRLIEQLLQNGIEPEAVFVTDETVLPPNLSATITVFGLENWQLEKLTETENPQKIAVVVKTEVPSLRKTDFLLYLDDIKEPGNLGTIFRTAAAAGIDGIVLSSGCCEIFNPKVIRASLGTVFSLPAEIHDESWLRNRKAHLIATTLRDAVNLYEASLPKGDIVLIIGSEAVGIRPEILELADTKIKIPLSGQIESLNAAVATGIIIYHLKYGR
ncbi:MAG TPA: RNA methyltransferase [Candidatus Cloacimonadota bacterium]|nr:RNA methyltransferase [Candidatus Cloacimonadota bacterium]